MAADTLFEPFRLGPITLRNRFIRAGANEGMVVDGAPSRALVKHHRDLSAGGVGLTTVAYGAVSDVGRTLPNQVWLRPDILPDLRVLADGVPGGATVEDGIVTAQALEAAGADLLVLSGGRNVESGWFMFGSNFAMDEMQKVLKGSWITGLMLKAAQAQAPRVDFREMYFLDYSRRIRAAVKVPLGYLGGVSSLHNARQAMAEGFDAVVMARPLIHDPALVAKWRNGAREASGCTHCNRCVPYIYHPAGTWCVMNPANDPQLNRVRASM